MLLEFISRITNLTVSPKSRLKRKFVIRTSKDHQNHPLVSKVTDQVIKVLIILSIVGHFLPSSIIAAQSDFAFDIVACIVQS